MKKSVLIFFGIFMLASTIQPTRAMESGSDSDREEGMSPRNNQRNRIRENKREKLKKIKKELDEVKFRLSHLEEFKEEVITTENNKRVCKDAGIEAESKGREAGKIAGLFSGLAYGMALSTLLVPYDKKTEEIPLAYVNLGGFLITQFVSNAVYFVGKKDCYESLKAHQSITVEQKIKLKKKYHKEEFKANAFASVIAAFGFTAAALGVGYVIASQPQQKVRITSITTSFLNTLPHAVIGIAGLKWLTYTGTRSYKKWSRGNPPQAARA